MKKLISLVLALALVMLCVGAAFAASTGKIKIDNATIGQSYTLYKVFDATVTADRTEGGDGINYTSTWFKTANDYFDIDAAGNISAKADAKKSDGTLSDDAIAWLKSNTNNFTNKGTITAEATTIEWTGLEDGYYYVSSTVGTLVTVTSITPNVTVKDKNTGIIIDKVEDEPTNDFEDTVNYTVTITLTPGSKNVVFHDTLTDGLDLQGTAPTVSIAAENYTVTKFTDEDTEGVDDITISFSQTYLDSLHENTDVTIQYSAKLNEKAVVNEYNDAYIKYGENNDLESEHKTVYESTFKFNVNKVDEDGTTALNGAEFVLSTDGTLGDLNETLSDATKAKLLKFDSDGNQDSTGDYILTANNNITFNGLDADAVGNIYYLYEVKAPDGYNKLTAPVAVKITPVFNTTDTTKVDSYTVAVKLPGATEFRNCDATESFAIPQSFDVENHKGTTLPSTGGIGTTIFYILGGLLVIGAAVILVARRKAHD